jgi:hypothetical protein
MGCLRSSPKKVPRKVPSRPELFARDRIRFLTEVLEIGKFLELQGLNSRGNVEQVMKDVKSQASKNAAPGKQGGLNAEIQSRIGHQLRAMYDDVVRQGVPDRFADLIRKLDVPPASPQVDTTGGTGGNNNDGRD